MIKEALIELARMAVDAAGPKDIDFQGRKGVLYPGKPPVFFSPEVAGPLRVTSLSALVTFIAETPDPPHSLEPMAEGRILDVASPTEVQLRSGLLRPYAVRESLIYAQPIVPQHCFGHYLEQEEFVIWVRTCFEQDDATAAVLRLVGGLRQSAVRTLEDDGVSQLVTTSRGIQRVGTEVVPNPVVLRPFRTFPEIQQPQGEFILRLRGGGEEDLPEIALIEVENQIWQREAKGAIAGALAEELGLRNIREQIVLLV